MAGKDLITNVIINGQTTAGFNALAGKLQSMGATIDSIGSYVRDFEKESVEVYRNYEDNMLAAEYALSAQYDDVNELRKVMRELDSYAAQWASTSIFHTDDVSQAINEAAHAGWDYSKIIEGIPQAMLIAQAGSLDLSTSLDYLVKMMGATGTEFDDVGTVIDQWSKAANLSATNIGEMGEAFISMGAAAQFAANPQEIFTLLAVLANVGTTGSQAGTALRGAMMRLIAPTTKAEDAMSLLGADADEINEVLADESVTKAAKQLEGLGFSAYDAEGNLLPMLDILTNLHDALSGLDEQSRYEILSAIFPLRNIAAANAFYESLEKGRMWEIFEEIGDSEGYAAKGADIMMSGLTGSVETLKSKWEEFQRSMGETLAPWIEGGAETLGGIMDAINGLDEAQMSALAGGLTTIAAAGPALMVAGGALKLFSVLGPYGTAALLAAVGIGALVGYVSKLQEMSFEDNFGQMELDLDTLGEHVDSLNTIFDDQQSEIQIWSEAVDAAAEKYATNANKLSQMMLTDVLTGKKLTDQDIENLNSYAQSLVDAVWDGIENAEARDMTFLDTILGRDTSPEGQQAFQTAANVVDNYYGGLYEEAAQIGKELRDSLTREMLGEDLSEQERQAIQDNIKRLNEIEAQIAAGRNSQAYYAQLYKAQSVSWDSASEYITQNAEKLDQELKDIDELYANQYGYYRDAYDRAKKDGTLFTDLEGNTYTITGNESEDDPRSWAYLEKQLQASHQKARQSAMDKYGGLDAVMFDALIHGSDASDLWDRSMEVLAKYQKGMIDFATAAEQISEIPATDSEWDAAQKAVQFFVDAMGGIESVQGMIANYRNSGTEEGLRNAEWWEQMLLMLELDHRSNGAFNREMPEGYASETRASNAAMSDALGALYESVRYDSNARLSHASFAPIEELYKSMSENEQAAWDSYISELEQTYNLSEIAENYGATTRGHDRASDQEKSWLGAYLLSNNIVGAPEEYSWAEQQMSLDTSQAEADAAAAKESIEAMDATLHVTAQLDTSAVDNYSPGGKTYPVRVNMKYALGGRATRASIFGEAEPEWAIPEEHSQRTAELLDAARRASGFTWGDLITRYGGLNANPNNTTMVVNYSPTIQAGNSEGVAGALESDKNRLMRMIKKMLDDERVRNEAEVYA